MSGELRVTTYLTVAGKGRVRVSGPSSGASQQIFHDHRGGGDRAAYKPEEGAEVLGGREAGDVETSRRAGEGLVEDRVPVLDTDRVTD